METIRSYTVDENVFSDFVREHLETDIIKSGIVLNREVQLRPSVARSTGERTDIHVDALGSDQTRRRYDILTIVIETKGAWNAELLTAMRTQLRERYMAGTSVRRAVYLTGWFASALWTSDDPRRDSVPREGKDAISAGLAEQARELSTSGVRIASVVVDASLPGEPSKTGRAAMSDRPLRGQPSTGADAQRSSRRGKSRRGSKEGERGRSR